MPSSIFSFFSFFHLSNVSTLISPDIQIAGPPWGMSKTWKIWKNENQVWSVLNLETRTINRLFTRKKIITDKKLTEKNFQVEKGHILYQSKCEVEKDSCD